MWYNVVSRPAQAGQAAAEGGCPGRWPLIARWRIGAVCLLVACLWCGAATSGADFMRGELHTMTYNPLNARAERAEDISLALCKADVVLLLGTQRRLGDGQCVSRVGRSLPHHDMYCFSYHPLAMQSNKSAGCAILLRRRTFKGAKVMDIRWPDFELSGSGGMLRVKGQEVDIGLIAGYFPPWAAKRSEQDKWQQTLKGLVGWTSSAARRLPSRCTPVTGVDLNDDLDPEVPANLPDYRYIHRVAEGCRMVLAGKLFAGMLQECDMMEVSGMQGKHQPTYYSGAQAGRTSRIDFLAVPTSCRGAITSARPLRRIGRSLQAIQARRPVDHVPVLLCLRYRRWWTCDPMQAGGVGAVWDYDKLMRCVQVGEYRREFHERLLEGLERAEPELEARTQRSPDKHWQKLVGVMHGAGQNIFGKGRARSAVYAKLAKDRRSLLRRRWRLRCALAAAGDGDALTKVMARLGVLTRQLRGMRRTHWQERKDMWVRQLREAWRRRDLHAVHDLTRKLAGTCRGPRRRVTRARGDSRGRRSAKRCPHGRCLRSSSW